MVGESGAGDFEGFLDLAGGRLATGAHQEHEDAHARLVGEGLEGLDVLFFEEGLVGWQKV